jgi:transcriptional regulator with XRE-family HTH domain
MKGKIDPIKETDIIISNIKKFRELKNITREQIADELELSASGYSKIERGEIELSVTRLLQIANVLDIEVAKIMNFDVTTIFNISNNSGMNGQVKVDNYTNSKDEYLEKYVKILESENQSLKTKLNQP